ncbi:MAG TPA: tripartite tricarboxylate transporter substrate binding protein BugD [Xanthobacteraceae bacterium]|jgi:tripartite-type tricarboxylate transporter receptor subunit TctC|nr:tripartite tricarboxylate transporter substrate binding protein BugD [Xanthobacteraceae bacterium]
MTLLRIAAGCVLLWGGIAAAPAQVYPSRPITMVVPFAAGGPVDTVARILSEPMRATLGQSIIVENVTGAAGSIGVGRVARAAPDGYTLSIGHWSTHVVNGAIYPLPYDLLRDLEPIVLLPSNPMIVVSKSAVPAKNLNEFVGWIKANEGKVSAGTAGAGSATHVAGVYFQNVTGTRFQFVPYRGTGPALQDLVAGQIDFIVDQASNSLQHVRDGKIRAYAVTASARLPSAPDIPTVAEAGLPSLDISVWYGLWAPKGTPKEIIAKLNAAAVQALSEPAVRQRFAELGLDMPPRDRLTPEALAAYQKAEIEKWWPVIKDANIKTE